MELVTFESQTYQHLESMYKDAVAKLEKAADKIQLLQDDKLMGVDEAADYIGFGPKWVKERKEAIGFVDFGKDLKFKKSDLDAYIQAHHIKKKFK